MKPTCLSTFLACALACAATAQTSGQRPNWLPQLSGTIRTKAEYQTHENESRFEVRNARVALDGQILPSVAYKAEVDLSDEGRIRMLDAYGEIRPLHFFPTLREEQRDRFSLRLGQMRVPFSIDAHRSPHKQLFANRSFIAKQAGDVRDVGLMAAYAFEGVPITLEAGAFNGSGLTAQKDYWTHGLNYSAKATLALPCGLTLVASTQKVAPESGAIYLYDGGATFRKRRWTLEAEYLRKHYSNTSYHDVNALNSFVRYSLPLKKNFESLNFLARFDMMDDHSDGTADADGRLQTTDAARKRLTGGMTLRFTKKVQAELRLNYEKYFYDDRSSAKVSERDKVVLELMIHFP